MNFSFSFSFLSAPRGDPRFFPSSCLMTHSQHELLQHVKWFLFAVLWCDWSLRMDSGLDRSRQDLYTVKHPHLSDTVGSIWRPTQAPVKRKGRVQEDKRELRGGDMIMRLKGLRITKLVCPNVWINQPALSLCCLALVPESLLQVLLTQESFCESGAESWS